MATTITTFLTCGVQLRRALRMNSSRRSQTDSSGHRTLGGGAGSASDLTAPSTGARSRSFARKLSAPSHQKSSLKLLTKVVAEDESPHHVDEVAPRIPPYAARSLDGRSGCAKAGAVPV